MDKALIIALVTLVSYFATLRYKFVSDDIPVAQRQKKPKNLWQLIYRWVMVDYHISPEADHLLTIIIHTFVCIAMYYAFGANQISFFAALMFSINPAVIQGSIWISGRAYALSALLLLTSMAVPVLAPILLLACTFFTVGFVIPIALIGSSQWYLLAIVPICWLIWSKKFGTAVSNKATSEGVPEDRVIHPRKLILGFKTMAYYFSIALIPYRTTFYHSFMQSCAGNKMMRKKAYTPDGFFWGGLLLVAFWGAYIYYRGWDTFTYGMLWYFLTILPFCNIRRVQQEISERYLYIPAIGVMLALGSLIYTSPVVFTAFFTAYIARFYSVRRIFKNDYLIIEGSILEDHLSWYVWHIRGHKRWETKSYNEALIMWTMARLLSPREFKVLFNIAAVLMMLGKKEEAEKYLKAAEDNIIEGQEKDAEEFIKGLRKGEKTPLLI